MKITAKKFGKLVATMGVGLVLSGVASTAFAAQACTGTQLCNLYWKQSLVNDKWQSDSKGVCVKSGAGYKWADATMLTANVQAACPCPESTTTAKYSCSR